MAGIEIVVEHHLIVGDIPGHHPAVDNGELVGTILPMRNITDDLGKLKGLFGVLRLARHLIEKGEC